MKSIFLLFTTLLLLTSCGNGEGGDQLDVRPDSLKSKLMYLDPQEKTLSEIDYLGNHVIKETGVISQNIQVTQKYKDKYYFASKGNDENNPSELYSYDGESFNNVSNFSSQYETPNVVMVGQYAGYLLLLAQVEEGDFNNISTTFNDVSVTYSTSLFLYDGSVFLEVKKGFIPNRGENPLATNSMSIYNQGDIFETENYLWIKGYQLVDSIEYPGSHDDVFTVLRIKKDNREIKEFAFAQDEDTEIWDVFIDHNEELYLHEYWFDNSKVQFKKYDEDLDVRGPNLVGEYNPNTDIAFYHSFDGENSFIFFDYNEDKLLRLNLDSKIIDTLVSEEVFSTEYFSGIVRDGQHLKIITVNRDDSKFISSLYTLDSSLLLKKELNIVEGRDSADRQRGEVYFSSRRSTIDVKPFIISTYYEERPSEVQKVENISYAASKDESILFSQMTSSQNSDDYVGVEFGFDDGSVYKNWTTVGYWEGYPLMIADKLGISGEKVLFLLKGGQPTKLETVRDFRFD